FQVLFISLCGFNLKVGVSGLLLHLRVRKFNDNCRWVDLYAHASLKKNLFHSAVGRRRYPASYLGHEGSVAANVAYHLTAFDGLDDRGRAIERGCGGLQLRETVGNATNRSHADHDHDGIANLLLDLRFRRSLYIHNAPYLRNFVESCNSQLRER